MTSNDGYLGNHFLVSMPQLEDENFARTVTLICQHDSQGALGIVINRLSQFTLGEVFEQLEISVSDQSCAALPVYEGGPVHQEFGLVIHTPKIHRQWESTLEISEQLSLTSSRDILVDLASGDGPGRAMMSLGYAGWGPGQLEQEMLENAWLSTPVSEDILFDTEISDKWFQAAQLIGVDYNKMTTQFGHA